MNDPAAKLIAELQATIRRYPAPLVPGGLAWVFAELVVSNTVNTLERRDAIALFVAQISDMLLTDDVDITGDPWLAPAIRWGKLVRQRMTGGET